MKGSPTVDLAAVLRCWGRNDGSVYVRIRAGADTAEVVAAVAGALPPWHTSNPVTTWPPVGVGDGTAVLHISDAVSRAALESFVTDLAAALARSLPAVAVDTFGPAFPPMSRPGTDFFCTVVVMSPRLSGSSRAPAGLRDPYTRADVEREALAAVVELALGWLDRLDGERFVRLGTAGLRVERAEQVALLRAALPDPSTAIELTTAEWPRAARQVHVTDAGQVIHVFGSGEGFDPAEAAVGEAVALLEAAAPWVVHGYAFRTTRALADVATMLEWTWPHRTDVTPGQLPWLRRLEGERAYDAFGVQLLPSSTVAGLGDGPADHVRRDLGTATLLVHRNASRWFAGQAPPAEELAASRALLAPILVTPADVTAERSRLTN